jgi:ribosomal protein S18 acetylase RimI-like enzyme
MNEKQVDSNVEIAGLDVEDLDGIARIHIAAFPESELGRQGAESVKRNYRFQFEGPHDLTAIGARLDGALVGFLFGGVFRGSTIGFVKREWRYLLLQALRHPSTLLRPVALKRALLAVQLLFRRAPAPMAEDPTRVADRSFGVLSIAVDPAAQGMGIGGLVMEAAIAAARALDFEQMHLTVHRDNHEAIRFYERFGWTQVPGDEGGSSRQMVLRLR